MLGHHLGDETQVSVRSPGPINQACLCNIQLASSDMEALLVTTGEYELRKYIKILEEHI